MSKMVLHVKIYNGLGSLHCYVIAILLFTNCVGCVSGCCTDRGNDAQIFSKPINVVVQEVGCYKVVSEPRSWFCRLSVYLAQNLGSTVLPVSLYSLLQFLCLADFISDVFLDLLFLKKKKTRRLKCGF